MSELFEIHWAALVRNRQAIFTNIDREMAMLFYAHGQRDALRMQIDGIREALESMDRTAEGKEGSR